MTAQQAKEETMWRSLPIVVQLKIKRAVEQHTPPTYGVSFYESVTPEAFENIRLTINNLEFLGYNVTYEKVLVGLENEVDYVLSIKW